MNKCIGALLSFSLSLTAMAEIPSQSGLPLRPASEHSLFLNAILSILVAALFLSLACFGLLWWRKRMAPNSIVNNEYTPVVKTTRRITQKTTLITVMWQGQVYLLAESQGVISVLDSVPIEVAAP